MPEKTIRPVKVSPDKDAITPYDSKPFPGKVARVIPPWELKQRDSPPVPAQFKKAKDKNEAAKESAAGNGEDAAAGGQEKKG